MLVCVIYCVTCVCVTAQWTIFFHFHYGVGLMHSCTCPFNGIPSMENNQVGGGGIGPGHRGDRQCFPLYNILVHAKNCGDIYPFLKNVQYLLVFLNIFSHFSSKMSRSSLLFYCDFDCVSVFWTGP